MGLYIGISTREVTCFDPAIRLTLATAQVVRPMPCFPVPVTDQVFQALQDSDINYRGSNMGTFFGNLLTTVDGLDDDRYEIDSHNGIRHCVSIHANCISFIFDLRSPLLTVDTGMFHASITIVLGYTPSFLLNSLLGISNCDAPHTLLNETWGG